MWSGHVYNLETIEGWFFAGNIVTHNCLHHLTPYVPGYSKLPSTDFSEQEKKTGMTSDEYYAAKQRQRGMERKVRSLKRKVALGQERGLDMTADRYRLGRAQANLRGHCERYGLRRDYGRERAYAVAQQPRGLGHVAFNSGRWQGQYPNPTAIQNGLETQRKTRTAYRNASEAGNMYQGTKSPFARVETFD
jgi:hypothetical protein